MSRKGDPTKQPPECAPVFMPDEPGGPMGTWSRCPNIENTYEGFDGERWDCAICGESYFLDYEDMK